MLILGIYYGLAWGFSILVSFGILNSFCDIAWDCLYKLHRISKQKVIF